MTKNAKMDTFATLELQRDPTMAKIVLTLVQEAITATELQPHTHAQMVLTIQILEEQASLTVCLLQWVTLLMLILDMQTT